MNPRIRQRRMAVRRRQGRRRLRILVLILSAASMVGVTVGALHSPLLEVRHIEVTGAVHVGRSQVIRAGGLGRAGPMIDLPVGRVAAGLDRLPWVATATVARHWPDTVAIRLSERRPLAQVRTPTGEWAEIDRTARVLQWSRDRLAGLPVLEPRGRVGKPGSTLSGFGGADARGVLAMIETMPAGIASQVDDVRQLATGDIDLDLHLTSALHKSSTAVVELGSSHDLGSKMASLEIVLSQVDLTGVTAIDVRVPQSPTIVRSPAMGDSTVIRNPTLTRGSTGSTVSTVARG